MENEDRIETEGPDTEAHKLSQKVSHGAADEGSADPEDRGGDEPDVEGHKLANKLSQKFDV